MPGIIARAAVLITLRGHNALIAMPSARNSSAMPSTHWLMPNLAMVYATCGANHLACMSSGGDRVRICGLAALRRCGRQACEQRKVPRMLTWCMRS